MDLHEDIGDFIKEKLHTVEKPFEKDSWPKIQDSLHKKRKKRKIAFFIKLGVLTLLLSIVGLSILKKAPITPINSTEEVKSQEKVIAPNDNAKTPDRLSNKQTVVDKNDDVETQLNNIKDSIESQIIKYNGGSGDLSKTRQDPQAQIQTQTTKQETKPATLKTQKELPKEEKNNVPQVSTTKKVYYYYNSKNGQEISSMDKRVIDSVMRANEYKQDSIKIDY